MKEQDLQKKIMDYLEGKGFHTINIITASKNGEFDIVACSPKGRFVGLEVKLDYNESTKLQVYKREKVLKCNGIAGEVYSLDEVKKLVQDEL